MSAEAKLRVGETGATAAATALGEVEKKARQTAEATKSLSASVRDLQKEWEKPTKGATVVLKGITDLVSGQARAIAQATMAPGMTTYAGAIEQANRYRQSTQQIATATGQSWKMVSEQTDAQSKKLGLLPDRVHTYGRSVRQLTGDWQGAMAGMEGFNTRAQKTDRTLEEMIPMAADLAQNFGIKNTSQVNQFFGTLDAQARAAGVSIAVAEHSFSIFADTLANVTSTDTGKITGLMMAFQKGAPTAEVGRRGFAGFMGLTQQYRWGLEAAMRAKGRLGKREHIFDNETGMLRADKLGDAAEFLPGYLQKFYGKKNKGDTIEVVSRLMFGGDSAAAASLLNLKPDTIRQMMATKGTQGESGYLGTDAGKRGAAEANKAIKDRLFGQNFLGAQDAAVSMGGGAAGIAMGQAMTVFDKSVGMFSEAVKLFVGRGSTSAATGAVAASTTGTLAKTALAGTAATVGLAAGAAVLLDGNDAQRQRALASQTDEEKRKNQIAMTESALYTERQPGMMGWIARHTGKNEKELEAELAQLKGEQPMTAREFKEALSSTVLKTQQITAPTPPAQSQPL